MDKEFLINNGIDVDASLELLGDMEMYNELTTDFLNEAENRVSELKGHIEAGDTANYAILAHSIKSDSKYLGYKKLAEVALKHELAGKASNIDEIKEDFNNFMNELAAIINIVKKYLN